jgi:hypothetical protein
MFHVHLCFSPDQTDFSSGKTNIFICSYFGGEAHSFLKIFLRGPCSEKGWCTLQSRLFCLVSGGHHSAQGHSVEQVLTEWHLQDDLRERKVYRKGFDKFIVMKLCVLICFSVFSRHRNTEFLLQLYNYSSSSSPEERATIPVQPGPDHCGLCP